MGVGCQPWTHFQDSHVPRSFLINWPLASLAYLCTPCADHSCSNCSGNLPGSLFHHLRFKYANRTSVLLLRKRLVSISCLVPRLSQTCPIPHFMHRKATAVYKDFWRARMYASKSVSEMNMYIAQVVMTVRLAVMEQTFNLPKST
jgi:hypothetical protein